MIYQVCELDKKTPQKMYPFLRCFLVTRGRICSAHQGFRHGSGEAMLRTPIPLRKSLRKAFDMTTSRHRIEKHHPKMGGVFYGDPWENRTPVSALRGPCLSRLTNEPYSYRFAIIQHFFAFVNSKFEKNKGKFKKN